MKYALILIAAFTASSNALADEDAVKMCVTMLTQKQASAENKLSEKQINTYCNCIIPKLEGIKAGTTPTNKELNVLYKECQSKAGIK